MIRTGDYVYIKCLVTAAMPLGTGIVNPDDPDVVDLIPVDNENNIIKRYENKPLCLFIADVMGGI